MNIQTVSVVIPTRRCVNNCKFCVSCMHENKYEKSFDEFQIMKRIKWATMNNVNTCIITGTGEAFQNFHFLTRLADVFIKMNHPFPNVEFQTTGIMLTNSEYLFNKDNYYNINVLKELGVNTISLSVSDIFDDKNNMDIIGVNEKLHFKLKDLCEFIKTHGFNIRISLNLLDVYNSRSVDEIIDKCKFLGANQITFRKMYCPKTGFSAQEKWVKEHGCNENKIKEIKEYINGSAVNGHQDAKGKFLYQLPFGAFVYSVNGMSVVIDDNCMGKNETISLKFVILRENGKLYSQWDDEGSLIF